MEQYKGMGAGEGNDPWAGKDPSEYHKPYDQEEEKAKDPWDEYQSGSGQKSEKQKGEDKRLFEQEKRQAMARIQKQKRLASKQQRARGKKPNKKFQAQIAELEQQLAIVTKERDTARDAHRKAARRHWR